MVLGCGQEKGVLCIVLLVSPSNHFDGRLLYASGVRSFCGCYNPTSFESRQWRHCCFDWPQRGRRSRNFQLDRPVRHRPKLCPGFCSGLHRPPNYGMKGIMAQTAQRSGGHAWLTGKGFMSMTGGTASSFVMFFQRTPSRPMVMIHMILQAARLNALASCDSQADLKVTMGVVAQEKTEVVSELHRCPPRRGAGREAAPPCSSLCGRAAQARQQLGWRYQ